MNKWFYILIIVQIIGLSVVFIFSNKTEKILYKKTEVVLGSTTYILDIADTPSLQERGLSYRKSLSPKTGMLFVFENEGVYQFWMKDMNFPIDIIWLDKDKKVVYIEHSLIPQTYPKSFGPTIVTQYVIEIPARDSEKIGLKVGDIINL